MEILQYTADASDKEVLSITSTAEFSPRRVLQGNLVSALSATVAVG
jgi:hypothetical protein